MDSVTMNSTNAHENSGRGSGLGGYSVEPIVVRLYFRSAPADCRRKGGLPGHLR
jgi:hypothetical protein